MTTTLLKMLFSKASAHSGLCEDLMSRGGKEFQLSFHLLYECDALATLRYFFLGSDPAEPRIY